MGHMSKRLLTIKEVCAMLGGYGPDKVRKLIRDGAFRTKGAGRGLRIVAASVEAWLEEDAACPAKSSKPAAAKVKARTSGTPRIVATSGESSKTDSTTKSTI